MTKNLWKKIILLSKELKNTPLTKWKFMVERNEKFLLFPFHLCLRCETFPSLSLTCVKWQKTNLWKMNFKMVLSIVVRPSLQSNPPEAKQNLELKLSTLVSTSLNLDIIYFMVWLVNLNYIWDRFKIVFSSRQRKLAVVLPWDLGLPPHHPDLTVCISGNPWWDMDLNLLDGLFIHDTIKGQ